MPRNTIRILIMGLVALAVLTGLSSMRSDGAELEQYFYPPPMFKKWYPDLNTYELMEVSNYLIEKERLRSKLKAGEDIDYGSLRVTSQPSGAEVWINSFTSKGTTPLGWVDVLARRCRITVRKQGYYPQSRVVDVGKRKKVELDFKFQPIAYARLTVEVRPSDAKISIIGVAKEYEPGIRLVPGEYLIKASHRKFGEHRLFAHLMANQQMTLTADLTASPGGINVKAIQNDATVYLDGQEMGQAPISIINLLPGLHKLQVWKSLFKPTTKLIRVELGKVRTVVIDLAQAEHFTNSLGMEFVKIPAGQFMMGLRDHPDIVAAKAKDKEPQMFLFSMYPRHLVEITKPFFMQTTEVTNRQWHKLMGAKPLYPDHPVPVDMIPEIMEFIALLNKKHGGKILYRLPTEAEWEYACRAGTTSPFYTGETIGAHQANYDASATPYGEGIKGKKNYGAKKVKSYPPNPWGLYDMHGNVWELCSDWFDITYYLHSPVKNPIRLGPGKGANSMRGGSFNGGPMSCLSAYRAEFRDIQNPIIGKKGFRLVAERTDSLR